MSDYHKYSLDSGHRHRRKVECTGCGGKFPAEVTERVGDGRYCQGCAIDHVIEAGEANGGSDSHAN